MTEHEVGTREEWLAARKELLEEEKELTRRSDELARKRQALPWVRVEKEYLFETNEGTKTLAELFDGRSQLIVYHFMYGPNTPDGLSGLHFPREPPRRRGRPPQPPRRDVPVRIALAARDAERLQAPHGLELPVGVVGRNRLQPRLQPVHRGTAA